MEEKLGFHRSRGVALLALVLVCFVVLSIFSVVAFSISTRTLGVERWQREHYERSRLTYIARSAVNAAAEEIARYQQENGGAFDCFSSDPFNAKSVGTVGISDFGFTANLQLTVSGDIEPYLYIEGVSSNAKAGSVVVSALYDTEKKKIVDWGW